jgi:hypothetical protein
MILNRVPTSDEGIVAERDDDFQRYVPAMPNCHCRRTPAQPLEFLRCGWGRVGAEFLQALADLR